MAEKNTEQNMELWKQVCKTDPKLTKGVSYGDRKFTAVCAQSQMKRATELWGSYGGEWGVKGCTYLFVEIRNEKEETKKVEGIALKAIFYYPNGEFEIATDMPYRPQGDCMKKLLTDLTTKALSKLGFNSDVFEGKFDDNKYVDAMNQEFGNNAKKEPTGDKGGKTEPPQDTEKKGTMTQNQYLERLIKERVVSDKDKATLRDVMEQGSVKDKSEWINKLKEFAKVVK